MLLLDGYFQTSNVKNEIIGILWLWVILCYGNFLLALKKLKINNNPFNSSDFFCVCVHFVNNFLIKSWKQFRPAFEIIVLKISDP